MANQSPGPQDPREQASPDGPPQVVRAGIDEEGIESLLPEPRRHEMPCHFVERAHITSVEQYERLYAESIANPDRFWAEQAAHLHWFKKWDRVLQWSLPDAKWFAGGKTNLCDNCIDHHVEAGFGQRTALVWESEALDEDGRPETIRLSFSELQLEVARLATVLTNVGLKQGDVATLYLPMSLELAFAMLACTRIGVPHVVISPRLGAPVIHDRVTDAGSRLIITADAAVYRGRVVPFKPRVDEAIADMQDVQTMVLRHAGHEVAMTDGRDFWWHDLLEEAADDCPPEPLDSEDLAFILYTSGTTGKPRGVMHTLGGYMVHAQLAARYVFALHGLDEEADDDGELFWCAADLASVTGHTFGLYGALLNRVPVMIYEGATDYPDVTRIAHTIARQKVTHLYCPATTLRRLMRTGRIDSVEGLDSLRLIGSTGEPLHDDTWTWCFKTLGRGRCPIVDAWWQTETGAHVLAPLPGVLADKPGSVGRPFFGIKVDIRSADGTELPAGAGGNLAIANPWPGMVRGIYAGRERFIKLYWQQSDGAFLTGDCARRDERGDYWMLGRAEDVIEVGGRRLAATDIEGLLISHPDIVDAAVVATSHDLKEAGIAAFVVLREDAAMDGDARRAIADHVARRGGAIARPDALYDVHELPVTHSGRVMRRLLREIVGHGQTRGDTTTLANPEAIADCERAVKQGSKAAEQ